MKQLDFDVVVIGGGHAGVEAAHAAARMGCAIALVTLKIDGIGVMSCNPAIGGLGKGHLVREIDALDGIMGRMADSAGIQFRLLNRRKGPAVQGPRAQADRAIYRREVLREILEHPGITLVEGEVVDIQTPDNKVRGVILADGTHINCKSVVVTTGTFLRGVIHIGDVQTPGGRMGDRPATRLAERFDDFGLPLGRLKTGTPPRLLSSSIDWESVELQPGDDEPTMFSFLSKGPVLEQVACGITHTNTRTHEIIRKNLARSAMYGGIIDGVGPRYCPSIEDKVVRFADKNAHQIFLEPEGLNDETVYPNGISTSLPADVQREYVQSIRGLESAEILQPGYAIEYDYVDPRSLEMSLQVRGLDGLFLAGQINGTTGYEEAAAQGLVAGLNAAQQARGRDSVIFRRSESYIGVMIDDLVMRGVSEPYRMFTSRAEFRLSLRADNADQRLTERGIEIGCVGPKRAGTFRNKAEDLSRARSVLNRKSWTPGTLKKAGIHLAQDGPRRTGFELLGVSGVRLSDLRALDPEIQALDPSVAEQVARDAVYSNYLKRQQRDVDNLRRDEAVSIPDGFRFDDVSGLSNELKEKLVLLRPESMDQAARIEGMTPSGLTLLLAALKRRQDRRVA